RPAHARSTQRPGSRAAPPGGARGARHAVLLAALLGGCGSHRPPPAPPPPQVGVVVLHEQSVPLTRELVGRLSAMRVADVRARVAGVLLKRLYKEGSDVSAGQTLFQIDPAPLRAALDGAEAALAQAEANATNTHIAAERARELVRGGLVSRSDLDNAEAAERSTAAAVQQARAPDGSVYAHRGTLDFRDLSVDPATGAVALRALVPNPEHQLLPGMFVGVRLTSGVVNRAFLVPQAALQRDGTGPYLLTVGPDDRVVEKRVAVEALEGPSWIVTAGLADGDRVIVSGTQNARPGATVAAVLSGSPGASARAAGGAAAAGAPGR